MSTLILALFAMAGTAHAAGPTPDRPSRGYAGTLVSAGSIEVESGWLWRDDVHSVPTLAKYSTGAWEPRVGLDLGGFGGGAPGLSIGSKLRLAQDDGLALSLLLESALPIGAAEVWSAKAWLLMDATLGDHLGLNLNTGIDLVEGPDIYGVPVIVGVSAPLTGGFSLFGELSTEVVRFQTLQDWMVCGGAQWAVTSIVVLDGGLGYELDQDVLWLTLGLTVNLGNPGG